MRASPVITVLRVLTWCGVILLAVLSLLPGEWLAALSLLPIMKMVRTVLPAPLEHFIAYAGGGGNRYGGLWLRPCQRADHWQPLRVRRYLGVHPRLFAGAASGDREVCRFGARSALRWARRRFPLASRLRPAQLRGCQSVRTINHGRRITAASGSGFAQRSQPIKKRLDGIVNVLNGKVKYLHNISPNANHWILLKLAGVKSN